MSTTLMRSRSVLLILMASRSTTRDAFVSPGLRCKAPPLLLRFA